MPPAKITVVRFGVFEADLCSGELRRNGARIKVQEQPFKVLAELLARPGELVSRETLCLKVWGSDTFVNFEHSLSIAINKLREALGDSADNPRFIQTVPRRGYRFIAPVEELSPSPAMGRIPSSSERKPFMFAAVGFVVLCALVLAVGAWRRALLPPIRSVAVLPLENLTSDQEQDYIADGITETLITDLGRVSTLRVISSTSVRQYKSVRKPLSEIGRELNVDAVVEGALLRSGDRIRITVHLVRLPVEKQVWSQVYEGDLRELSALQVGVAGEILSHLRAQVGPQEESLLTPQRRPSSNPDAYRLYSQGRYLASKGGVPSCKKSLAYFEQAIEADPSYALAYAGLADSYGLLSNAGALDLDEGNGKMKAAALKALELDDQLGEAHESLGYYYLAYEWNWAMAEAEFRRTIKLSPNFADAHEGYALHGPNQRIACRNPQGVRNRSAVFRVRTRSGMELFVSARLRPRHRAVPSQPRSGLEPGARPPRTRLCLPRDGPLR